MLFIPSGPIISIQVQSLILIFKKFFVLKRVHKLVNFDKNHIVIKNSKFLGFK